MRNGSHFGNFMEVSHLNSEIEFNFLASYSKNSSAVPVLISIGKDYVNLNLIKVASLKLNSNIPSM